MQVAVVELQKFLVKVIAVLEVEKIGNNEIVWILSNSLKKCMQTTAYSQTEWVCLA